jgi:hypothetical protein
LPEVFVVQLVSNRNVFVIPTVVASGVAGQQQNPGSPRIERIHVGDPSLPPYRIEDNQPQRDFPPVIVGRLAK